MLAEKKYWWRQLPMCDPPFGSFGPEAVETINYVMSYEAGECWSDLIFTNHNVSSLITVCDFFSSHMYYFGLLLF